MPRKNKLLMTALISTPVIATGILLYTIGVLTPAKQAAWGRAELKLLERTYYTTRYRTIIDKWRRTSTAAGYAQKGRIKEPYNAHLVIDMTKSAIWLEENGQVATGNFADLPENMKWKLYRSAPQRNTDLPAKVRLKIRGRYRSRELPETICLIGYGRGSDHLSFYITSGSGFTDYGAGPYRVGSYKQTQKKTNGYYESILVSDDEYEQYRRLLPPAPPTSSAADANQNSPENYPNDNLANWLKIEKHLYQQIEATLLQAGFKMEAPKIMTGLDYTAARAYVKIWRERGGLVSRFIRLRPRAGWPSRELLLKIDYLGEDFWYVKAAPYFEQFQHEEPLNIEFLVRPTERIKRPVYKKWLAKGRQAHGPIEIPVSKWMAALPNGVTVELLGVCESASIGRKWWGPDGNTLTYEPYFFCKEVPHERANKKTLELAWRINWPSGTTKSEIKVSLDNAEASHGRGGTHPLNQIMVQTCTVEKSVKNANLKLGIGTAAGVHQWVTFEKVSLVRGQNQGFRIALEN